jgi:hypothetical protein
MMIFEKFHIKYLVKKRPLLIMLYYDSTVEPFDYVLFDKTKIRDKISVLKKRSFKIEMCDIAGWPYKIIKKVYADIKKHGTDKFALDNTFLGPGQKIYFGREIPGLVVYYDTGRANVYPILYRNRLITIDEFLNKLINGDMV